MTEKLELVEKHRERYGLNRCLEAVNLSKGSWHRWVRQPQETQKEARDKELKTQVLEVVCDHPAYGYRKIQRELKASGVKVNHKRLRRVLNRWDLALPRTVKKPKARAVQQILCQGKGELNLLQGWSPRPLEALSTDFTELRYVGGRKKAYLMALIDIGSRWVVGWAVGPSANRELALACWGKACRELEAAGHDTMGLIVHQDQDPVYTSHAWLRALLLEAGAVVSYSERGAKDNPWVESLWSHFKGENSSLLIEADTLSELEGVVDQQMIYHNEQRRHASLDYVAPVEYLSSEGIHVKPLAQNTPSAGSTPGAHVRLHVLLPRLCCLCPP